jgi:multiple sugar transport system permease protein
MAALTRASQDRPRVAGYSSALARRRQLIGFLFVLPALAFVVVFFLVPLAMTGWMSLQDWPLLGSSHFIGLQNYRTMASDSMFWQSLGFTTKYTVIVTPCIFLVGFSLALLVRQSRRGVGLFRTAYFLPVVIGLATTSYLWSWLYNDQVGVFDGMLQGLGIIGQPIQWLADPISALMSIVAMVSWKTGGIVMLLMTVGMQAIPSDLYEAATVDGAGAWARLRCITIPLLRRTFALTLVISVIGSYLAFDPFYIMTSGGPNNQTVTVVYWIYDMSFTYFRLGYGAALSMVLLLILLVISAVQLYLLRDTTQV